MLLVPLLAERLCRHKLNLQTLHTIIPPLPSLEGGAPPDQIPPSVLKRKLILCDFGWCLSLKTSMWSQKIVMDDESSGYS